MTTGPTLPEPLAQGDLRRTPFAHLLLYIHRTALTGTLVVWQPDETPPKQDRIRFEHGQPVAARLSQPASRLERGLLPLFARPHGPYAFYEGHDLVGSGENMRAGSVALLPLLAASLRGSCRDDVALKVCEGFGDSKLRLTPSTRLADFDLLEEERALLERLRAEPMTVKQLAARSSLPPRMAERLVYLLALTKSLDVGNEPPERPGQDTTPAETAGATNAASSSPANEPPRELSAEHREQWNEIRARAEAIEHETYFEMLGVPQDAPVSAIQKAYFNLVKRWHPDRLPRELGALKPEVERVFQYLTRAHDVLSNEESRRTYLTSVQDGGGTPAAERRLASIVQAAVEFRKVEVLARRREWTKALALLDKILAIDDGEADYHAARGWILFQQRPNDVELRPVVLASLDRAIELSPKHDNAHYYKGMVLERAGERAQAAEYFRRAAELNPKNIEAARMVRLSEMRASNRPAKSEERRDSLLGKLFGAPKKKK